MISLTVMKVGGEQYAISTVAVREVVPVQRITRVPGTAPSLVGVTNVRGRVVPVVDLRRRLGFPPAALGKLSRMVLVEHGGEEAGLLVDEMEGVISLPDSTQFEVPLSGGAPDDMVQGLVRHGEAILMALDLSPVLRLVADRGSKG